ncbi:unnamed protein product, partial [Rotaria sordida]
MDIFAFMIDHVHLLFIVLNELYQEYHFSYIEISEQFTLVDLSHHIIDTTIKILFINKLRPYVSNNPTLINNQITKTHTDITIVPPPLSACNQTLSTPRRPLDESNSSEFQVQSRTKKSRPHESTPTNVNS